MLFLAANAFKRKGVPLAWASVCSVTKDSGLLSRQAATLPLPFYPDVMIVALSIVDCVSCVIGILLETAAACSVYWFVESSSADFSSRPGATDALGDC